MRASHEAGALHAEAGAADPPGCVRPTTPTHSCLTVGHHVTKSDAGVLSVAGVSVADLAAEFGTPAYIVDEDDFRQRAREFKQAFAGWGRLLRRQGVPLPGDGAWIADEGLDLDVCTGGELTVALRAGFAPGRIWLPWQQQELGSWSVPSRWESVGSSSTRYRDRAPRQVASPPSKGCGSRCSCVSRPASRLTRTNTSPPPMKTRSSASRSLTAGAEEAMLLIN